MRQVDLQFGWMYSQVCLCRFIENFFFFGNALLVFLSERRCVHLWTFAAAFPRVERVRHRPSCARRILSVVFDGRVHVISGLFVLYGVARDFWKCGPVWQFVGTGRNVSRVLASRLVYIDFKQFPCGSACGAARCGQPVPLGIAGALTLLFRRHGRAMRICPVVFTHLSRGRA